MHKRKIVSADEWTGPKWIRYFQTFNINMTCVALGLIVSAVGPTLIDLSEVFHTTIEQASNIGMITDIGATVGPFFASLLYGAFNAQVVIIITGFLVSLSNILIPFGDLHCAYGFGFASGVFGAILEIGAYIWLVGIWKGNRAILQLYSLMFGVGAFFSPLITKPFLSSDRDLMGNVTLAEETDSQVEIPFALIGSFGVLISLLMAISFFFDPTDVRPKAEDEGNDFVFRDWLLTGLVSVYHFLIVLCESSFTRFLVIFAIQANKMSKGDAAILVSLFWVGFNVVRVIIIPVSIKLRSVWIVLFGQIVLNCAAALFVISSGNDTMLYVCTVLFGVGMAPLYGGSLAWLTEHITLRHAYLSVMLIFTCVGSMISAPLISPHIKTNPQYLLYCNLYASSLMLLVLLVMVVCARCTRKTSGKLSSSQGIDNPTLQVSEEIDPKKHLSPI